MWFNNVSKQSSIWWHHEQRRRVAFSFANSDSSHIRGFDMVSCVFVRFSFQVCVCVCVFANMGKQEAALKATRAHKSRIQVLEEELEVERMGYVCARRAYKRELSTSYTQRVLREVQNRCRC